VSSNPKGKGSSTTVTPILLDTCAAIWMMNGEPLSAVAQSAIRSARAASLGIYVSPFVAWEIGTLIAKGQLLPSVAPEIWFETLLAFPGFRLAPLTPKILMSSTALPGTPHKDPADRIFAATAREYGLTLITRDRLLLDYARQGHIQAICC